jgi:hypothetical protein
LILVVFAYGWFFDRVAQVKASSLDEIKRQLQPLETKEKDLQKHEAQIKSTKDETDAFIGWVRWRLFWPDVLGELRNVLMTTERTIEEAKPGYKVGVWIENLGTASSTSYQQPGSDSSSSDDDANNRIYRMDPRLLERYGLLKKRTADGEGADAAAPGATAAAKSTNELDNVKVKFRAVNLNKYGDSSANSKLAYVVENALQSSQYFDKDGTKLSGELDQSGGDNDTFTFGMVLKLRYPGAPNQPAAAKKK